MPKRAVASKMNTRVSFPAINSHDSSDVGQIFVLGMFRAVSAAPAAPSLVISLNVAQQPLVAAIRR